MQSIPHTLELLWGMDPYSLKRDEKRELYQTELGRLCRLHYERCGEYGNLLDGLGYDLSIQHKIEDIPFFPVRLFKSFELLSVDRQDIIKTMNSSGTTGQSVSKIYLNKENADSQIKALAKIMGSFLGNKRLPMLILDTSAVIKDRKLFSARGAGILGFSMLGHHTAYALDERMKPDFEKIAAFLERYGREPFLIFGFTYMIWQHWYRELRASGHYADCSQGILLHGGGFKKLREEAVDNTAFKSRLKEVCGLEHIYNYYGMVEQTGSVFMECECGRLHASNFSDLIIRNTRDFSVCGVGEKGLVQLVSLLPVSYPGHSILTEDVGELTGEDDCPCGRMGKTFKLHGRIQAAEIRGCSDTYEKRDEGINGQRAD